MSQAIIALLGVILGGALTFFNDSWSQAKKLKKDATYLSVRIVCIFDDFCAACSNFVDDNGLDEYGYTPNGYLEPQVPQPKLQPFPEDVNWTSIDSKVMYSILSIPNQIAEANRRIHGLAEIDFDDAFEEGQYQFSIIGKAACQIVLDISDKYRVELRNRQQIRDILSKCMDKYCEIEKKRKLREAAPSVLDAVPA